MNLSEKLFMHAWSIKNPPSEPGPQPEAKAAYRQAQRQWEQQKRTLTRAHKAKTENLSPLTPQAITAAALADATAEIARLEAARDEFIAFAVTNTSISTAEISRLTGLNHRTIVRRAGAPENQGLVTKDDK